MNNVSDWEASEEDGKLREGQDFGRPAPARMTGRGRRAPVAPAAHPLGRMLAFKRKRLLGSYLFFSATSFS